MPPSPRSRHLTLEEISDRIQINDLLVRYTDAIDKKDMEILDSCFTPDAEIDYTTSGGIKGSYPEVREWLARALAPFSASMHFISNSTVELRGERASARTYVLNPMGTSRSDGGHHMFTVGAFYVDELVHTDDGWRICTRFEQAAFFDGSLPPGLEIPK